ncbi:MAG: PEFG-CTERM sorting domain-containing protein [Nitrosopumilaceae archaeon]
MKKLKNSQFVFLLIVSFSIVLLVSFQPVFGQLIQTESSCPTCVEIPDLSALELYKEQLPLVIWIDPTIYDHNSIIQVNGHSNSGENLPVTLSVTAPNKNVIAIDQALPDSNGDFSFKLNTAGKLWKQDGKYIITANLGNEGGGLKTFRVQALVLPNIGADSPISYEIQGGKISSIKTDVETTSLIVSLKETKTDGILRLYLPRTVIDAKLPTGELSGIVGGNIPQRHKVQYDDEFVVMLDGKTVTKLRENLAEAEFPKTLPIGTYTEKTILDTRILTISFPAGSERVEIIGTFIIPEFGTLTLLVLLVTIASVIIVTRKQKNFFTLGV